MIELVKEPENLGVEDQENCVFCCQRTQFWSFQKDVPVCPNCSTEHSEEDVPSKEDWFKLQDEEESGC